MKWTELKGEITSLSSEEKQAIELMARLASIRKEKQVTQVELSKRTSLSQAQIARAENYTHAPSIELVVKLAEALDLELVLVDKETREIIS